MPDNYGFDTTDNTVTMTLPAVIPLLWEMSRDFSIRQIDFTIGYDRVANTRIMLYCRAMH
ncbi:protein of unknown function [Pseudodesulfovibrio piezophilus C1TLV30]|uniref:Uncharacterized protein n=1 Tax=Pseudodesulfovibrio piezophilus (strain DSM 21447 / JCM 15486 / C1TLV30) TaxID=1322246 RepID=M1WKG9_PSEP2|nr:protein of unknown function [Pseudodesulfovibrio piezophilus C1TLV30]